MASWRVCEPPGVRPTRSRPSPTRCSLADGAARGRGFALLWLARDLGALATRLRQTDRDRLLPALHLCATATSQGATLPAAHRAFDVLGGGRSILPGASLLPRGTCALPRRSLCCHQSSLPPSFRFFFAICFAPA